MRSWLCRETMDELKAVPSTVDAPHLVNIVVGGKTPMVPTKELGDMGFSLVLYANVALQGAVQGMTLALRALKDGGDVSETCGLVTSGNPAPYQCAAPNRRHQQACSHRGCRCSDVSSQPLYPPALVNPLAQARKQAVAIQVQLQIAVAAPGDVHCIPGLDLQDRIAGARAQQQVTVNQTIENRDPGRDSLAKSQGQAKQQGQAQAAGAHEARGHGHAPGCSSWVRSPVNQGKPGLTAGQAVLAAKLKFGA